MLNIHLATLEVGLYLRRTRGKSFNSDLHSTRRQSRHFPDSQGNIGRGGGQSGGTFEYIFIFHKQCMLSMFFSKKSSQKPRTSLLAQKQG